MSNSYQALLVMPLAMGLLVGSASRVSSAEEPDLKAIALDSVKDYVVECADSTVEISKIDKPIVHFTTYGIDEGNIFLWTEQGRPALAGQVFRIKNLENGLWLHEFQSLSTKPFTLSHDGREIWKPTTAGIEWQSLKTDLVPAETERGRLTQFKLLAREFTGVQQAPGLDGGSVNKRFGLTMKPRESYRYQSTLNNVRDGVIFIFTHEENTDPELLLLMEVVADGNESPWRFALARMSCWSMQVEHKGTHVVADFPNMLDKSSKSDPYHIWRPALQ